jgi:hypothetical protein
MRTGAKRWTGCDVPIVADRCEAPVYAIVTLFGGDKLRVCLEHGNQQEEAGMLARASRVVE